MDRDREFREATKQALRKLLEKPDRPRIELFDGFAVSHSTRVRIMQKLVNAGCVHVKVGTGGSVPTLYSIADPIFVRELLQDDVALTRLLWPSHAEIVLVEEILQPVQNELPAQGESSESQAPGADLSESIDMLGRAMAGCLGLLKAMSDRLDGIEGTVNALLKEWQGGRA